MSTRSTTPSTNTGLFATKGARLRLLIILGSLSAFPPMSLDLYLPAFPQMATDLGVQPGAIQLTFSASLLGLTLGQLIYGPMADRFGRKRPMIVGLVIFILASIGCALAPTLGILVALRFIQALGGCGGMVIARAIIRDCYSGTEMARMMSAMMVVFALAPVLAPSIGAAILTFASWHWLFVFLAAFGAYCLIAVLTLPETLEPARRTDHGFVDSMRAYRSIARNRQFLLATLISACSSTMLFAYISSSPTVFMDSYGVTAGMFGVIFGLNSVFFAVGAQVNMRLLRRFEVATLLRGFLAVQTVGAALVLAAAVLHLPILLIALPLMVAMLCFGGVQGNATTEAMRPFAQNAGSAAALSGVIGMGCGTVISAVLGSLNGSPPIEMGVAMLAAVVIGLVIAIRLPTEVPEGRQAAQA